MFYDDVIEISADEAGEISSKHETSIDDQTKILYTEILSKIKRAIYSGKSRITFMTSEIESQIVLEKIIDRLRYLGYEARVVNPNVFNPHPPQTHIPIIYIGWTDTYEKWIDIYEN